MTHGTHACYAKGCRCADCTRAHREYERGASNRRRHPEVYGPTFVDAAPFREVLSIVRTSHSRQQVAAATGASLRTLTELTAGNRNRIRRDTAEKLRRGLVGFLP